MPANPSKPPTKAQNPAPKQKASSASERRAAAAKEQAERLRRERRKEIRRAALIAGGAAVALVVGVVVIISAAGGGSKGNSIPAGTKTFKTAARNHTEDPVTYPQNPPVGGPHFPVWQNCGYYSSAIKTEMGVHSMEHGAVWITYRPDLPADQVAKLQAKADSTYILVTPLAGIPTPVVASAWDHQLQLDTATDPRLDEFVRSFRQGPQTPEPGALCTSGNGQPE